MHGFSDVTVRGRGTPQQYELELGNTIEGAPPAHRDLERALGARAAGEYLAQIIGCATSFSAQQMWALARTNQIPAVRIGRRVFFQRDALEALVSTGGSTRTLP
jgi:hypothetical protein